MERVFTIPSENDIDWVAKELLTLVDEYKVVAFYGEMGVGKTTFIKALCKIIGVEDRVTSPSFSLVNEYQASEGAPVFHFDFYRLKNAAELFDMGYEDYFFSNHVCLVEWPEKAPEILPPKHLIVYMDENNDGSRSLKVIG